LTFMAASLPDICGPTLARISNLCHIRKRLGGAGLG
jgi:hypothetical protein